MSRIRTIRPEMLRDPRVARLSDAAHRLLVGAYLLADDDGRLVADVHYLAGAVFWGTARDANAVGDALDELVAAQLVDLYTVADRARPRVTLVLSPTDDIEITCCICGHDAVDFEFRSNAAGRRSFIGIHGRCAKDTGVTENIP